MAQVLFVLLYTRVPLTKRQCLAKQNFFNRQLPALMYTFGEGPLGEHPPPSPAQVRMTTGVGSQGVRTSLLPFADVPFYARRIAQSEDIYSMRMCLRRRRRLVAPFRAHAGGAVPF